MKLVDTHCHLSDRAFDRDVDAVLDDARRAGLVSIVVPGYDRKTNEGALALGARHADVAPAVGFHPHEAKDVTAEDLEALRGWAVQPNVVAVGEIGLDFYRDLSPRERQYDVLGAQLGIAIAAGKPVSVHSRSAEDESFGPLQQYAERSPLAAAGRPVGVMHCFGGTLEQARRYVGIGFLISIACTITYPRNEESRRMARELPLESLVIETDSPYLPPQAIRGKRNTPAMVGAAATAIAEARGMAPNAVAMATTENAARLFALPIGMEARAQ